LHVLKSDVQPETLLTRIGSSSGLAGIVAIAIVGLLLNTGLRIIDQRLLFWHYRARIEES
jgi:hypothetical protein